MHKDSIGLVVRTEPRQTKIAGKIYVYNTYLFQNEVNQGIHVIDNSEPENPKKTAFYKIALCSEISIKNNHLYTDNGPDLLVLNILKINQPVEVKRLKNSFPPVGQTFPANVPAGTYFQPRIRIRKSIPRLKRFKSEASLTSLLYP